jgi:hypothetical protein
MLAVSYTHQQQNGAYKMTRHQLKLVYIDWQNNFHTVQAFADHYELHFKEAIDLLELARRIVYAEHPEK